MKNLLDSLFTNFLNSPVFGLVLSIAVFKLATCIYQKTKFSLLNPLLISIILIMTFLFKFKVSWENYNEGGQIITYFLGPATVILAVPLYKQFTLLRKNMLPIMVGITVGTFSAISSIYFLSRSFNLTEELRLSLIPKSITTPIGIEVSKQLGGIPSITVAAIVITGITGAAIAPFVLKTFRIKDQVAAGIAIGTSSHAIGTAKALELGETMGAMSGLAIGVAGLVTVFLAPLLVLILGVALDGY